MIRHAKRAALALLTAGVMSTTISFAVEQGINWLHDSKVALKRASAESKPIMVDVWAVWCAPCAELEKTTYRADGVVSSAKEFVSLKVDQDAQTSFSVFHSIDAWPTILFLDERGQEITRHRGYITAEPLEKLMATVSTGYPTFRKGLAKDATSSDLLAAAEFLDRCGNPNRAASLRRKAERAAPTR